MNNTDQENNNNEPRPRGRTGLNPLLNIHDSYLHAMFYRTALAYARAFPKPIRRILEFAILLKVSKYPIHMNVPDWFYVYIYIYYAVS